MYSPPSAWIGHQHARVFGSDLEGKRHCTTSSPPSSRFQKLLNLAQQSHIRPTTPPDRRPGELCLGRLRRNNSSSASLRASARLTGLGLVLTFSSIRAAYSLLACRSACCAAMLCAAWSALDSS